MAIGIFEDMNMIDSMFLGKPYYACDYQVVVENHKLIEAALESS